MNRRPRPYRNPSELDPLLTTTNRTREEALGHIEVTDVHPIVHRIRNDLLMLIDTPLSPEQISSPAVVLGLLRPLEEKYFELRNEALIFSLLVNRVQFISDQTHGLSLHSVNATRATICEILATNLMRRIHAYDIEKTTASGCKDLSAEDELSCLLKSANVLAKAFSPFQGASRATLEAAREKFGKDSDLLTMRTNAVEMAIIGEAKQFIRSPACQRVIEGIWRGTIVYSATSFMDVIPDLYKRRPVSLYNPRKATLLNHYRLSVPRIRAILEYAHYGVLVASYVTMLQTRELDKINGYEAWFIVYTLGFGLDKVASALEHGWRVYLANLWNGFDSAFLVIFVAYLVLRIIGLHSYNTPPSRESWANEQSHQVLATAALLIFPRIAFVVLSDNILVLSLRAMLSDFVFLMFLCVWCFLGFVYCLWLLGEGQFSIGSLSRWMVYVFFGLDGTGIRKASEFHFVLGPLVWVLYACLSNTLLVTVLVSILSKIFADVTMDATAETLYRRTVLTFEGVKSDAIFNYQPPFNLLALLFLFPLRFILTPRKFHSVHVFCTRVINAPILLLIAFFERHLLKPNGMSPRRDTFRPAGGKTSSRISSNLQRFGAHSMIRAAFETDEDLAGETTMEAEDELSYARDRTDSKAHMRRATEAMDGAGEERPERKHRHRAHSQPGERPHHHQPRSALARLFVPQQYGTRSPIFPSSPAAQHQHQFKRNQPPASPSPASSQLDDGGSTLTIRDRPKADRSVSASRPASIVQHEGTSGGDDYIATLEERLQQMQTQSRARMDRLEDGQKRIEELLSQLVGRDGGRV